MMNFNGSWSGSGWMGFHIHMFFGLLFFVGLVLFLVWSIKFLSKKQLLTSFVWFLAIGAIGALLTSGWCGAGWSNMHGNLRGNSWNSMIDYMEDEDYENLNDSEQWQEHMLEEMKENMDL